ncbi:hypothetical protein KSP40_PGU019684 [Platanthera guangdongensis]|uniref:Uncharacterized protein n=1 Tax=Platanthera guangdongensis TaxID=2320717 RepID=A0ABR2MWA2_9ASPA
MSDSSLRATTFIQRNYNVLLRMSATVRHEVESKNGLKPEKISESVHHEEAPRRPFRRSGTDRRKICAAILLHSQSFAAERGRRREKHDMKRLKSSILFYEIDSRDVLGKARSTADEFLRQAKEKSESLKDANGEMAENAKEVVADDHEGDKEKFKERIEEGKPLISFFRVFIYGELFTPKINGAALFSAVLSLSSPSSSYFPPSRSNENLLLTMKEAVVWLRALFDRALFAALILNKKGLAKTGAIRNGPVGDRRIPGSKPEPTESNKTLWFGSV